MTDQPSDHDHDRDAFTAELTARVASPSHHSSLSPAVRSVVTETLDPSASGSPSLAVPIALVRATAAAGDDSDRESSRSDAPSTAPTRATLLEVGTSLTFLGGYARLRRDVLDAARATDRDRDVAILASDYLHASAHAALAGVSIPTDRHVDLYRVLTAGSATLATSFLERTGVLESGSTPSSNSDPHSNSSEERSHNTQQLTPTAVLGGTGSALGAAVAGSSRETLEAMRTYGESLVAAIDAVGGTETGGRGEGRVGHTRGDDSDDGDERRHDGDDPLLETVERVLLGDQRDDATAPADGPRRRPASVLVPGSNVPATSNAIDAVDAETEAETAVETHLQRARSALDRLPETAPRARLEAATLVPGMAVEPDR